MKWIKITPDTIIPPTARGILCLYKGLHNNTLIESFVRGEHGNFPWYLTNNKFECADYKYYCVIDEEFFPLPEL